jgi:GNAT superfamily N-acetyltransferase
MTMLDDFELTVIDNPPASFAVELEEQIDAFNVVTTGIDDARLLSIVLRNSEGALEAGLHGQTWGGTCQIKLLWVAAHQRRMGLGTAMMLSAEAEARRRNCHQIMLFTHSFQAREFYAKNGFETAATLPDNPKGHSDIVMIKKLADDGRD